MSFIRVFFTFIFLCPLASNAQITIVSGDMPFANDTFRISNAATSTPIDVSLTGTNYTWDFSNLVPVSQTVDSFISVSNAGLLYILTFSLGANAANVVQRGGDFAALPQFQVSDVYSFYNRSASSYRQVGLGGTISLLPTPLPIAFANQDTIYKFPMNYGNQDSCDSDYSISLAGLGAYQANQKRVNNVDGWGTVITPYGTFNALRIVAELTGTDSLYLDTLGQGFNIPRLLTRQYKWLANGEGVPVIQINTQVLGTIEQITEIRYKDSLFVAGVNDIQPSLYKASLFPNPSSDIATLRGDYAGGGNFEVVLTDLSGRFIGKSGISAIELRNGVRLDQMFQLESAGVFLVHLRGAEGTELIRWVRNR
jgi:hypothetical protein